MPEDAPPSKRAATEGYGAEVLEFDRYADDRETLVRELARERDADARRRPGDQRGGLRVCRRCGHACAPSIG
jgi:threonine dehydratase